MKKFVVLVSLIACLLHAQEKSKPDYSMLASMVTMKYDETIDIIEKQIIASSSAQEKDALEKALEQLNNGKRIAQINHKFICAILFKDFNMLKVFHKDGANVDATGVDGKSALIFASSNEGSFEIAKYLVENHANMNAQCVQGFTALICASCRGNTDIVKLLLEKGADMELKDKQGKTALWWAENQNHAEVVKLLKENVNIANKPKESITEKIVTP